MEAQQFSLIACLRARRFAQCLFWAVTEGGVQPNGQPPNPDHTKSSRPSHSRNISASAKPGSPPVLGRAVLGRTHPEDSCKMETASPRPAKPHQPEAEPRESRRGWSGPSLYPSITGYEVRSTNIPQVLWEAAMKNWTAQSGFIMNKREQCPTHFRNIF